MRSKPMLIVVGVALVCAGLLTALGVAPAAASSRQISIFQDDVTLRSDPVGTLAQLRLLGVDVLKVTIHWDAIAPGRNSRRRPRAFRPASPAAYPSGAWAIYDEIDREARADGIQVYFELAGGAPRWAQGRGQPPRPSSHPGWAPSPNAFEAFVHAVGVRYDGSYRPAGASTPLPRVSIWSVWSEPNLGYSLSPQGVLGDLRVENSGHLYRRLLDAAWAALRHSGHRNDTFLIGELGPRGGDRWGEFQVMKPLVFLRALYCVDSSYRELRGWAARIRGCPTTAAGSRRFRAQHPALFRASGFADHTWMRWYAPQTEEHPDPDYSSLAEIGQLFRSLDRVARIYGSRRRMPGYNTEFGYITDPPNTSTIHERGAAPARYRSPRVAARYLNWAEYLSWKRSRIRSFAQYLLRDPPSFSPRYTAWSSGLLDWQSSTPKATYAAWRLPLYVPVTSTSKRGARLEAWGCIRPATYALIDTGTPQIANIQFAPANTRSFTTVRHVTINPGASCYFSVYLKFPSSGTVRLAYTYPEVEGPPAGGSTILSRNVQIYLH